MKNISNSDAWPRLQEVMIGLVLGAALIMALAAPAHADNGRVRGRPAVADRDWREHEGRAHSYWHRSHFTPEPGVIYAPPVVYAPPQYEEPGFNLVIPLNFR